MYNFANGLRTARVELEKQAGLAQMYTAGTGALAGAGIGAVEGALRVARHFSPTRAAELDKALQVAGARVGGLTEGTTEHAAALREHAAAQAAVDRHAAIKKDLYIEGTPAQPGVEGAAGTAATPGRWKKLHEAPSAYAKHFGMEFAKPVAGWAGGLGTGGAINQYAQRRAFVGNLKEYAPMAAAGIGGLAAYKALGN